MENTALQEQQAQVLRVHNRPEPAIFMETHSYLSDGVQLALDVYRPDPQLYSGLRPGIMFFFGGGFRTGSRQIFSTQAAACAAAGYVAVSTDYRVAATHGTTPRESLLDGAEAWNYIRNHGLIWQMDPERITLAGGSAGGLMAASCAALTGVAPQALVLFNPAIPGDPAAQTNRLLGESVRGLPLPDAEHPGCPAKRVLILHGEDDAIILPALIRTYAEKLRAEGVSTRLVLYPGAGHGFFHKSRSPVHFYLTMGELLQFLEGILPAYTERNEAL